jgi:hypothetical protein
LDEELLGAVGGALVGDGVAAEEGEAVGGGEEVAFALAEVGHLGRVGDALLVDPVEDLGGAEGGQAAGGEPVAEGLGGVVEDVVGRVAHAGRGGGGGGL